MKCLLATEKTVKKSVIQMKRSNCSNFFQHLCRIRIMQTADFFLQSKWFRKKFNQLVMISKWDRIPATEMGPPQRKIYFKFVKNLQRSPRFIMHLAIICRAEERSKLICDWFVLDFGRGSPKSISFFIFHWNGNHCWFMQNGSSVHPYTLTMRRTMSRLNTETIFEL